MEFKDIVCSYAEEHLQDMFNRLKDEVDIGAVRAHDTCLGFVDALYWLGFVDEKKANDISDKILSSFLENSLDELVKEVFK